MNRIKHLRSQHNMKQAELAALLKLSRAAISNYEAETRELDAPTIRALCSIFNCTSDYLLGLSSLPGTELTMEEESLLLAWRRSDERARDIVLIALAPFASDQQQSETG